MRRIILMAVASSALALAAPGVASAHHARHHRLRTHHAHKSRVRHFGSLASTTAPTPSTPVTPAGTVKSFTEGVLTITLANETTVSGKVTEDTELSCVKPGTEGAEDDHGDSSTRAVMSDNHGDQGSGDDQGGGDDQGEDEGGEGAACTVSALVPGAVVLGAELRIGSSGAVWKDIVLSS